MWCCLCDPTFCRFSRTPACDRQTETDRHGHRPTASTADAKHPTVKKSIWILTKQEIVSGSGISWATCKSAPCSRQITMPAPHHSVFTGRMPFLLPNQQRQITEGNNTHYTPDYIQQRASVVMTKKKELTLYSSSQWRRWLTASLSRACSSFT